MSDNNSDKIINNFWLKFKINKWCNCTKDLELERINMKCYDYVLEAIAEHEKKIEKNTNYNYKNTVLIPINKYILEFMQKKKILNYFKPDVVFDN